MTLSFTACNIIDESMQYTQLKMHKLSVKTKDLQGNRRADSPIKALISITNNSQNEFKA